MNYRRSEKDLKKNCHHSSGVGWNLSSPASGVFDLLLLELYAGKNIEVTCFNKTPCEIIVPLKYVQYNTAIPGANLPVYTRENTKYNIHCVPEKNILFLTFHRHFPGGLGCHHAMYQVTDPAIRQRLIGMWQKEVHTNNNM